MRALALLGMLIVSLPAGAWGSLGHRVVGEIAQRHASARTLAQVHRILGVEDLAQASTWPDEMRSSPEPFWQKEATPWHYVTVPPGKSYAEVGAPPQGDAVTALARFSRTLRDATASREEQALALRFIVHLVGDLHMPLHAGNGSDHGGNDVKVTWLGQATNLHAVWDSDLLLHKGLSYTELTHWLMRQETPAAVRAARQTDPLTWIAEDLALRDALYPADPQLGYDYEFVNEPIAEHRLWLAGVRLAAYLDEVFAPRERKSRS